MSDELPEGWTVGPLEELTSAIQYGYTASAEPDGKGPRLLRITDIQDGRVDWNTVPGCTIDRAKLVKYQLDVGDIVFARSGATTGKSFLIRDCPKTAVFASYLIRVRARAGLIDPAYLSWFFRSQSYWEYITDNLAGNAQPNCNGSKLSSLPVAVAPFAEQHRIVVKIEELLEEVNRSNDRLTKVLAILKRFRQSVLAVACSGALTREWRNHNPTAKVSAPDNTVGDDEFENSDAFASLPESWTWTSLDDACEAVIDYRGRTPPPSDNGRIPQVRTTHVRNGRIDWNVDTFVTRDVYDKYMTRGIPRRGDVLFTMEAPLGEAAVVDRDERFSLAQRILLLRGRRDLLVGTFFALALHSRPVRKAIEVRATGTTVSGIAYKRFKYVRLPIPPLHEQEAIVAAVTDLYDLADAIERRVRTAISRSERLPQSILSKAFSGELVPIEAELARLDGRDYEPASVLLERIKTEVAAEPLSTNRSRSRGTAKTTSKRGR